MASVFTRRLCSGWCSVTSKKVALNHLTGIRSARKTFRRNIFCQNFQLRSSQTTRMSETLFTESFVDVDSSGGDIINLVQGAPGVRHLGNVREIMRKANEQICNDPRVTEDNYVLQYGPRLGSPYARDRIAKFLSQGYGEEVKGDNVVVTGGATNGLQLAATHFFKDGDVAFVEDPTYFIAIMMLKNDLKMNVVPVPADENGLDVDAYEKLLEQYVGSNAKPVTDQKPFRAMLYLIPTHNNPRGYCLPEERSKKIVQLARKYEVLNFCDDVYNLMHFDISKRAPPRFLTYDNPSDSDFKGHTLSNGTFAKIFAPGLRLGWYETSERLVESFRKSSILWSAGCTNHYAAEVMAVAIDMGLQQKHLQDLNTEYKAKIANLCAFMKENFPAEVKFNQIEGGYFIWIQLPSGSKGADVAKLAMEKHRVRIMPGANCSPQGNFQNCLRMSISYQDEDKLIEGARRLGNAIKEYLDGQK